MNIIKTFNYKVKANSVYNNKNNTLAYNFKLIKQQSIRTKL